MAASKRIGGNKKNQKKQPTTKMNLATTKKLVLGVLLFIASVPVFAQTPVVEYDFNTCAGTKATDNINGLDGTIEGPTWTAGYTGQGLTFHGAGSKVTIPDTALLAITDSLSVSAWIKAATPTQVQTLIAKHIGGNALDERSWLLSSNSASTDSDRLQVVVSQEGNGTHKKVYYSSTPVFDGLWHHVAFTFGADTLKLYIDGQEDVNVVKYVDDHVMALYVNEADLTIGYSKVDNADDRFFEGTIDGVKIYDTVLSAGQVATLANEAPAPAYCNSDDTSGAAILPADYCSTPAEFSNIGATPGGWLASCSSPEGNVANVWYKFQATSPYITATLTHVSIRYPRLTLWDASGNELDCRAGGIYSDVEVSAGGLTTGDWYYLSVDTKNYPGTFGLCLDEEPTYNFKAGALELTELTGWCSDTLAYSNYYATGDGQSGSCDADSTVANVWFKFQATTPYMTAKVIQGTIRFIRLALWDSLGNELECFAADVYGDGVVSAGDLTQGDWYYLSVDTKNYPGTFGLCLNDEPTYNYKAGAVKLTNTSNWCSGGEEYSTRFANADGQGGSCDAEGPVANVWFKFQATTPYITAKVMQGSIRFIRLALWDSLGNELACYAADVYGNAEVSAGHLTPGDWYYLSVDTKNYRGTFSLCLDDSGQLVTWKDLFGVSLNADNSLTKTLASDYWDAGVASHNRLESEADGWMEFVMPENHTGNFVLGFSNNNIDNHFSTQAYSVQMFNNGTLRVYEGSLGRGSVYTVAGGDIIKIERFGSKINYWLKGEIIRSLNVPETESLIVDASIQNKGTTVPNVITSFGKELAVAATVTPVTSSGDDGAVSVTVEGGDAPYAYDWSNGAAGASVTGLAAGAYTVTITDSEGRTAQRTYDIDESVTWKDLSGVGLNADNSLTKTLTSDYWDAGAASYNRLASGTDGWMEFVMPEDHTGNYIVGLSNNNVDNNFKTQNYSIRIRDNKNVQVYEGRLGRGSQYTATTGDVIKIERVGGTIKYWLNDQNIRTLNVPETESLIVDASIQNEGTTVPNVITSFGKELAVAATVTPVTSSGDDGAVSVTVEGGDAPYAYDWSNGTVGASVTGLAAGAYTVTITDSEGRTAQRTYDINESVTWKDLSGVSLNADNSLTKTLTSDYWDAGAASYNRLASGTDGWMEFVMPQDNTGGYILGLANNNVDNNFKTQNYSIRVYENKNILVFEGRLGRGSQYTATTGDVIKIERVGGTIKYWLNDQNIRTLNAPETESLIADVSVYQEGATVPDVITSFDQVLSVQAAVSPIVSGSDGAISLLVEGGSAPYTYEWSNGSDSDEVNNLVAGTYTVTVADGDGRTTQRSYDVNQSIAWKDLSGMSLNADNSLTKTLTNDGWDAGAASYNRLAPGQEGWMEFVMPEDHTGSFVLGLSKNGNQNNHYNTQDYSIRVFDNKNIQVYEGKFGIGSQYTATAGDVIKIERVQGAINYWLNSQQIRTISTAGTDSLIVDVSVYNDTTSVPNVITSFGVGIAQGQLLALRDFYEATHGANWTNNAGWPSTAAEWDTITSVQQISGWYGVTVENGNVTALEFPVDNNMIGNIPGSLIELKGLKSLKIRGQPYLNGPLPDLSDLDQLETLNLYNLNLDEPFPGWLSALSSLETLSLDNVGLTGSIPDNWEGLIHLVVFRIGRMNLSGTFPSSLTTLHTLNDIEIYHTSMAGYLPDFSSMSALRNLLVYNNNLEGSLPDVHKNVEHIYAYNNNFSGGIPDSYFVANSKLNRLYIQENNLTSLANFKGHNMEASLKLQVGNNELQFADIEANLEGVNSYTFDNFTYTPQKSPANTIEIALGENDEIVNDRAGGAHTLYQWQKWDGTEWIDIDSASHENYLPLSSAIGDRYRSEITNSWATDLTIYSAEFVVNAIVNKFYVIADGNWADPAIWSDSPGGNVVDSIPSAHDIVYVDNYTINVSNEVKCGEVRLDGDAAGKLEVSGGYLIVNGKIYISGKEDTQERLVVNNRGKIECK